MKFSLFKLGALLCLAVSIVVGLFLLASPKSGYAQSQPVITGTVTGPFMDLNTEVVAVRTFSLDDPALNNMGYMNGDFTYAITVTMDPSVGIPDEAHLVASGGTVLSAIALAQVPGQANVYKGDATINVGLIFGGGRPRSVEVDITLPGGNKGRITFDLQPDPKVPKAPCQTLAPVPDGMENRPNFRKSGSLTSCQNDPPAVDTFYEKVGWELDAQEFERVPAFCGDATPTPKAEMKEIKQEITGRRNVILSWSQTIQRYKIPIKVDFYNKDGGYVSTKTYRVTARNFLAPTYIVEKMEPCPPGPTP